MFAHMRSRWLSVSAKAYQEVGHFGAVQCLQERPSINLRISTDTDLDGISPQYGSHPNQRLTATCFQSLQTHYPGVDSLSNSQV